MRAEARIFGVLGIFFLIVTPIYWILSREVTGTVALVVTFLLALLLTFYLGFVSTRIPPRPEDRGLTLANYVIDFVGGSIERVKARLAVKSTSVSKRLVHEQD